MALIQKCWKWIVSKIKDGLFTITPKEGSIFKIGKNTGKINIFKIENGK